MTGVIFVAVVLVVLLAIKHLRRPAVPKHRRPQDT